MVDVKNIEKELKTKLEDRFLNKEFRGQEFPYELVEATSQHVAEIVGLYISSISGFNVKPIKQDKILLVSATDEKENTIADVMFAVDFPELPSEDYIIIKNIFCSLKTYLFEVSV